MLALEGFWQEALAPGGLSWKPSRCRARSIFFFFLFLFKYGLALKHLRLEKLWSRILDEVLWQVDVSHRGPGEASEPTIAFHSATAMGDGLAESAREA